MDTTNFVKENLSLAKLSRTEKIQDQDVKVYEILVKPEEVNAFSNFNDLTSNGGALRIYVAPGLGHVIPRLEHIGTSGKTGAVYEGSDFIQCNGYFFPQKASIQYIQSTGPIFSD